MSIIGRTEMSEIHHYEDDIGGSYCLGSENGSPPRGGGVGLLTPCTDKEKRIRREIANSNERRRMQSINAGFQSLRTLLPHHEGEKLSKAAILQQTAEYIYNLEQEKTTLLAQNCQLKRLIEHDRNEGECTVSKKRKTESGVVVVESADDGLCEEGGMLVNTGGTLGASDPDDNDPLSPSNHQELIDIRIQLDRERGLRLLLEEKLRVMQSKCYSDRDRIRDIAHHVQYETEEDLDTVVLRRETEDSSTMELDDMESNDTTCGSVTAPPTHGVAHTETVVASDSLSPLPDPIPTCHIKQEPRVEVESISISHPDDQSSCNSEDVGSNLSVPDVVTSCVSTSAPLPRSKVYIASASRPNLETIVEAIRHLEGDNLFEDGSQDAPLALTKHPLSPSPTPSTYISHQHQFQQQQRPGVIVVKHS